MSLLKSGGSFVKLGGSVIKQPNPLRQWVAALENVDTTPVNVLVYGDSVTQGQAASDFDATAMIPLVAYGLTETYNSEAHADSWQRVRFSGVGVGGTADYGFDNVQGSNSNAGLGGFARILTGSSGHACDITRDTDGFDFFYTVQKTGGCSLEVYIDDELQTTINTTDAGISKTSESARVWSSGALERGEHTLRVVATGSGTAIVDGCYVHRDTLTKGVRVFNAGHGGAVAHSFFTDGSYFNSLDYATRLQPDLVIIDLGRNNSLFGGSAIPEAYDIFVNTYRQMVDEIRSRCNPSILAVSTFSCNDFAPHGDWDHFREGLFGVAKEKNCAFLDLNATMGDLGLNPAWESPDGVHPGDAGMVHIANQIIATIVP